MKHSPTPPPLELEVKFRLPPDAAATLAAHPAMQTGSSSRSRHEISTYYDTPDRLLARAGIGLRVRQHDSHRIQTLKLPGAAQGGAFARQEWEWPVTSGNPDLHCLQETPLGPYLADLEALRPVFVTDVWRSVQTLQREGATIEIALDHGSVCAGAAAEPIHELELELKDGDPEPLYRFAAALHADVPMTLGTESKADRGWRLCTGHPREAVKQDALDLPPDASVAQAFRRITGTVLAHLLANAPAAEAADTEGVHQMRVAIRRLRSTLVLFRPLLEPHAEARFTAELRRLGRLFGEARDWDVFCTQSLPAVQEHGIAGGWIELLRPAAARERAAAHARVRAELQGHALTALTLGLTGWAGDPACLAGAAGVDLMHTPLPAVTAALVRQLADKVRRRGGHVGRRPQPELHALRKSLKKLRYGVEFLAPLGKQRRVKAYLHACKGLQEGLGTINDAGVAVTLAEQLGGDRHAALAPAVAALACWAAAQQDAARRQLRADWRKFSKQSMPF